jgi:hypothetical protein
MSGSELTKAIKLLVTNEEKMITLDRKYKNKALWAKKETSTRRLNVTKGFLLLFNYQCNFS